MGRKDFFELLDKYLSGNASLEEEQLLLKLYKQMEANSNLNETQLENLGLLEDKLLGEFMAAIKAPENIKPAWVAYFTFYKNPYLRIAVSLLMASAVTLLLLKQNKQPAHQYLNRNNLSNNYVSHINQSGKAEKISFPDGSYVYLAANSKIGYGKTFTGAKREVFLSGEGFFEVTKDHTKPFIVYADKIVVKVLGTSFTIKSKLASVLVKTGRVSVFKRKDFKKENTKPDLKGGVILVANHAAALNNKDEFERKLSETPDILMPEIGTNFNFYSTPVATLFDRLQKAYGIKINYDKEKFIKCSISVNLGSETFYEKLNVVCHTLNMTYEVHDGDVWVTGPGCGI